MNLVDLAGSERVNQTGATGSRFTEGSHINKSLLALSCVIQQLSENEQYSFINYRNSKLTRILQASLGGNAMTAIICTISPAAQEETYSTLSFGTRAKKIKNKPIVNEVVSDAVMLKRLERENIKLKKALESIETDAAEKLKLVAKIASNREKVLTSTKSNRKTKTDDECRRRTWCPSTVEQKDETDDGSSNVMEENKRKTLLQTLLCEDIPKHEIPKCAETEQILNDEEFFMSGEQMIKNEPIFMSPSRNAGVKKPLNLYFEPSFVLTPKCVRELKKPKVYPKGRQSLCLTPFKESIPDRLRQLKEEFEENYNFIQVEKESLLVEKEIEPTDLKLCLSNERDQLISFHRDLEELYNDICLAAKRRIIVDKVNSDKVIGADENCGKCAEAAEVKLIDQDVTCKG